MNDEIAKELVNQLKDINENLECINENIAYIDTKDVDLYVDTNNIANELKIISEYQETYLPELVGIKNNL